MTAPRKRAPVKRTNRAAEPKQSQRERLLGRPRPTLPYRILVDTERVEAARTALAQAQQDARQVRMRDGSSEAQQKAAQQRVTEAEAEVDACYEIITLRALPPRRVEELEAAHPPTDEQVAKVRNERELAQQRGEQPPDWPSYNDDTLYPQLLAESVDGDMTADDWTVFLAENVSDAERRGLQIAALQVNRQERVADPAVLPKDWMSMLNSRLS